MKHVSLAAALVLLSVSALIAQEKTPAPTVVLHQSGFWRVHLMLKPPVVRSGNALQTLKSYCDTEPPAKDWTSADFDDSGWTRLPGAPFASHNSWSEVSRHNVGFVAMEQCSTCTALISMRGKFEVADPSRVDGLKLSVAYRGGVVVYLNGKEITRGDLPNGAIEPTSPAADYPDEAFLKPDGSLLVCDQGEKDKDVVARWESRTRRLDEVDVPTSLLRKGVNILAIEVHRSPYAKIFLDKVKEIKEGHRVPGYLWSTCGLVTARLSATKADGLTPNVVRPKGVQVWNSPSAMSDFDMDLGDRTEPLRPVRIVGARGGHFSGKVVLGSDAAIRRPKAEIGNLSRSRGGRIDPSHLTVRYGLPIGDEPGIQRRYAAAATLFDALSPSAPTEVPVREKPWVRGNWGPPDPRAGERGVRPGQPETVFGAVVPIWVTVDVPRDATPGDYTGTLSISAEGIPPIRVPVTLSVSAFTLPEVTAYRTIVDFIESPESVAMQYDVPLWSDRHFELLGKSFDCLREVANRSIYIPLICRSNHGNEQSMVRWVKKAGDGYDIDFTVMERYVDLAIARMGKPRMVVIYAWDIFLGGGKRPEDMRAGRGVPVSVVDPATGKVEMVDMPPYRDEKSVALWKPLADGLRTRLADRGLESAMMLGVSTDSQPRPDIVDFFRKTFPGVPWMRHGHTQRRDTEGVPIAYQCLVWTPRFVTDPSKGPLRGWNQPGDYTQFCRSRGVYPVTMARLLGEMNIQGMQHGFGRIGLDFWPVLKDARGRRSGSIQARFPESDWRNLDWMIRDFVPAGPDGAMFTYRLMTMREGLQLCEARIVVEGALADERCRAKLPAELVARCERTIAERTKAITIGLDNHATCGFGAPSTSNHAWWSSPGQVGQAWYMGSGWQERSKALYGAAAEVAALVVER